MKGRSMQYRLCHGTDIFIWGGIVDLPQDEKFYIKLGGGGGGGGKYKFSIFVQW